MFSLLEQHIDGSWWYHPGDTFGTEAEVEQCFQEGIGRFNPDRPHQAFEHQEPLYQERSTCTLDFKTFMWGGMIYWPKSLKGTFVKQRRTNNGQNTAKTEEGDAHSV